MTTAPTPTNATEIRSFVQGFRKDIKDYKSGDTNEAAIRQQFIDRLWEALGWDVGDARQLGPTQADVIIEKNIETAEPTGLRNRRPDYLFRLGGFPRFIVEAKKPAADLDDDRDAIFQAKQSRPFTMDAVRQSFGYNRINTTEARP